MGWETGAARQARSLFSPPLLAKIWAALCQPPSVWWAIFAFMDYQLITSTFETASKQLIICTRACTCGWLNLQKPFQSRHGWVLLGQNSFMDQLRQPGGNNWASPPVPYAIWTESPRELDIMYCGGPVLHPLQGELLIMCFGCCLGQITPLMVGWRCLDAEDAIRPMANKTAQHWASVCSWWTGGELWKTQLRDHRRDNY